MYAGQRSQLAQQAETCFPPRHKLLSTRNELMAAIALRFTRLFYSVGRFSLLLSKACASLSDIAIYRKNVFIQMGRIGIDSIPIVILAAAFSGAVTTVQTSYQLVSPLFPPSTIGAVVVQSLTMELGAVITGFILSGRVGARIAAELGTMRVTEQIDALEVMGLNSVGYLIVPRVLAGILMFPILYVAACLIGIVGGIIAGTLTGTVSMGEFFQGAREYYDAFGPYFGLIKSFVFGFFITSISCYMGYYTVGGAEGVGKSTTKAAVTSCIYI